MANMIDPLEPEERAIWQVLLDAAPDDRMTTAELAATAAALAHIPIPEWVVHEVTGLMVRCGYAIRVHVRRRRRTHLAWAYALTMPGRARGTRLLAT